MFVSDVWVNIKLRLKGLKVFKKAIAFFLPFRGDVAFTFNGFLNMRLEINGIGKWIHMACL